ncbi:hypothetical protein MUCCIDRAFT_157379 [Mucor lusitanicus CBS 277.49]|uniref:Uncharacterized protein n=1 Tax=Mucor lusitanicus CBS 277.49 TaxID=747725 RepID=A0A168H4Q2_MUCCL|nr:hypothetical protein MUCCIDRAFT_157378 [Mucor lusitanicus CBS 277.49]OAC98364.1 hypothetical protein MUCCIDRAFT_157379 [Mucor lusitanicus CBS 277.49]
MSSSQRRANCKSLSCSSCRDQRLERLERPRSDSGEQKLLLFNTIASCPGRQTYSPPSS